jgi:transposase
MTNTPRQLQVTVDPAPGTIVLATDDPASAAVQVAVVQVPVDQLLAQAKTQVQPSSSPRAQAAAVAVLPLSNDTPLPDDVPTLQAMVRELLESLHQAHHDRDGIQQRLDVLLRKLFGPRAERFHPDQPWLLPELDPTHSAAAPASESPADADAGTQKSKAKGHGRKPLPEELRRERVEYTLTEAERLCPCCGVACAKFGEDISEQLDYHPASVFVRQNIRFKYACAKCHDHVVAAPLPAAVLPKGLPGPGLLAQITASKYADHLPLNRLERILGRHGTELSRSTMCGWMAHVAGLMKPIVDLMACRVRQSKLVHTDATRMPYLDPDVAGKTLSGQMWAYVGDRDHPFNVFDFCVNHTAAAIDAFLKDNHYLGYLNADALNIYDHLFASGTIIEVGCWAHCRRYFYDAKQSDAVRAHVVLARIRQLYAVEAKARQLIAEQKLAGTPMDALRWTLRQEHSVLETTYLHEWLVQEQPKVLPKSLIGQAIAYALRHWQALTRFLEDGFLAIDNNIAELTLRHIAIGRKNWLFAGSAQGAKTAATLFSVTSSCHRLGIDVFAYLRDVLDKLAHNPKPNPEVLRAWLPDRWQPPPAAGQDTS